MRNYENKELENVISQITSQLQSILDDPQAITDTLDFKAFMFAKEHLVSQYGFSEDEAARQVAKADFSLNGSGLSESDVENAIKDMIDMVMMCLNTIKENYGETIYNALYEQVFTGLNLKFE